MMKLYLFITFPDIIMSISIQNHTHLHYTKKIGAFRPAFQGKPESYYALTNLDICCGLLACTFVILAFFGLCIGLYFWSLNISTSSLVTTWSIILIIFSFLFTIAAFVGSKGKAEVQQALIKQALQQQLVKKQIKEKANEEFSFFRLPSSTQALPT